MRVFEWLGCFVPLLVEVIDRREPPTAIPSEDPPVVAAEADRQVLDRQHLQPPCTGDDARYGVIREQRASEHHPSLRKGPQVTAAQNRYRASGCVRARQSGRRIVVGGRPRWLVSNGHVSTDRDVMRVLPSPLTKGSACCW